MAVEPIHISYQYNSKTLISEEYAYKDSMIYERQTSRPGMELIIHYDIKNNSKEAFFSSRLGKYYHQRDISKEPNTQSLFENVSISIHKEETKMIHGFSCYRLRIDATQRGMDGHFEAFVTDAFSHLPMKHRLQKQFPEIQGFPLEIISNEFYSAHVTHISNELNWTSFEVQINDYKLAENKKTGFSLIKLVTGLSIEEFTKKMLDQF